MTYVWLGQAFPAAPALGGGGVEGELMERIRTGDVAIDLYRPVDPQLWWPAADVGRTLSQLIGRGVVPFVSGALFFPVSLPAASLTWAAFLGTVGLAMLVGFGTRFLVALSAFWLLDGVGVTQMVWPAGVFCSGVLAAADRAATGARGRGQGARQWLAFPADESAAEPVARVAAAYPLVDLPVREPDIEAVIGRMYAGKAVS